MDVHIKLLIREFIKSPPWGSLLLALTPLALCYSPPLSELQVVQAQLPLLSPAQWALLATAGLVCWWLGGLRHVLGNPGRHGGRHGFSRDVIALVEQECGNNSSGDDDRVGDHDSEKKGNVLTDGESSEGDLNDLSDEELKLLQYFFAITFKLGDDEEAFAAVWKMKGGGKPLPGAPEQLSFTALRCGCGHSFRRHIHRSTVV